MAARTNLLCACFVFVFASVLNWDNNYYHDCPYSETLISVKAAADIQMLDLSYHNIGDKGAVALADVLASTSHSLVSLNLQGNNIGPAGAG